MIFGILLGVILFVTISITLLGLYVFLKRYCSQKEYGVVSTETKIRPGRLYPVLTFKESEDEEAGGSGSTTQCLDIGGNDVDSPEISMVEDKGINCTMMTPEHNAIGNKEPLYVVPSTYAKHTSEEGHSSLWQPSPPPKHSISHDNEGYDAFGATGGHEEGGSSTADAAVACDGE